MKRYLMLSDEVEISIEDFRERQYLIEELQKMPKEFFAKMRHFQPQVGCLNCCSICSKFAGSTVSYWNQNRIRNVIAAMLDVCKEYTSEKPMIVWDREEHRSGVVFPYLDNDIGNYYYLYEYIVLAYKHLGVKTRVSTVGFSRYNDRIAEMHKKINSSETINCLAGVRLSFTPYEIGWQQGSNSDMFSREEYILDMAEFLKIYQPYYKKVGSGSREMCVELRYKPLAIVSDVSIKQHQGHFIIQAGNYLYISCEKNVVMKESIISNSFDHTIKLTEQPVWFYEIDQNQEDSLEVILQKIHSKYYSKIVDVYMLRNAEGEYYSINPSITDCGNYGINIYPKTDARQQSGYLITERFFLNALYEYKYSVGRGIMECFDNATWDDVTCIIELLKRNAQQYKIRGKYEKCDYILENVLPMVQAYVSALQIANYKASDVFNPNFTIDTGTICNLGRAIYEFNGLTQKVNEPLTPTHERNYGYRNSTMTQEGTAWRLSCDYNNKIVIQKLSLKDTSSVGGQVVSEKKIELPLGDGTMNMLDLNENYLVPGQIKK